MQRRPIQFGLRGLLLSTTACCIVFAGLSSAGAAMLVCIVGIATQSVGVVVLAQSTFQAPERIPELQDRVIEVGLLVGTVVTVFGVLCGLLHFAG